MKKKQVNVLEVPSEEWWYHLAVKKLPPLLGGIPSKHHGDSYCLNCLHSSETKSKLE